MYAQVVDRQPDVSRSDPPEETGTRNDDDALLEVRMSTYLPQRHSPDDGNRSSYRRRHLPHYSTMRRYVLSGSSPPRVDNMLEPPSPLTENPLEPTVLPPGAPQATTHCPPDPPIIPSVEMPDTNLNLGNAGSLEGNQRRTIGGWFRTMMKRRSHNETPHQMPSEGSPKAGPSNERPSTTTPAQRVKASLPFFPLGTTI